MYFQNKYTFTYQKTLLHTLFLLVFKIVESLQSICKTTPTEWTLCQISLPFSNFEDFKHIFKFVKVALIKTARNTCLV